MRSLSKSKVMAFRQCPKRLWLELHKPELRSDSEATKAKFEVGHRVGELARRLFDPKGKGVLLDVSKEGFEKVFARSRALLATSQPVFEVGLQADGVMAFADVFLPIKRKGELAWRMLEVKSSTSVKDHYLEDVALQALLARTMGLSLASVEVVHIDNQFVYQGGEDYEGLLTRVDVTDEALSRADEVKEWVREAKAISNQKAPPDIRTGTHCSSPHECGFLAHCESSEPQAEFPVRWLPRPGIKLKNHIEANDTLDMREVPDGLLNESQARVKEHTLSGKQYFDRKGAAAVLAAHKPPVYFLDFETVQFPVPIWKGTRPYQQIPFQFSVHKVSASGAVTEVSFLDLSGKDPSGAITEALIKALGSRGTIFTYNVGFESSCLTNLAERFPKHRATIDSLVSRLEDLLPVARKFYYHPDQQGSWSIKAVLPAIAPDLSYDALTGVKEGGMAATAYLEAIASGTTAERKTEIEGQLRKYCQLDTLALVRLWEIFSGRRKD